MHNKRAVPALLENGRAEATCPLPINNQKINVKTASVLPRSYRKTLGQGFFWKELFLIISNVNLKSHLSDKI